MTGDIKVNWRRRLEPGDGTQWDDPETGEEREGVIAQIEHPREEGLTWQSEVFITLEDGTYLEIAYEKLY